MQVLLLDIEGTTTSISFVYDVLFPYARGILEAALEDEGLLAARWTEPAYASAIATMMGSSPDSASEAARFALDLMDRDVKDTGLKLLQGLLWEGGYSDGTLRGHLFPDVAPALARAHAQGIRIAIYSSGSVAAQRLIFGFSVAGDLTPLIEAYFDTTTGPKRVASSYVAIAEALGVEAAAITFCTDHPDEARAALDAGCAVRVAVRPGNAALPEGHTFTTFTSLDEVLASLPRAERHLLTEMT